MKTSLAAALAALILAGCAHAPTEERIKPVEVKVPVREACVPANTPQAPEAYADANLPTGAEAVAQRFQFIAAANAQRKARLAILEPIIASCRR